MNNVSLPEDCAKQWDMLLLLLSAEEKKIHKNKENEIELMRYLYKHEGIRKILFNWLYQMKRSYARHTSERDTALKSDDIALLWRQIGNEKFRNNEIMESYDCYTKSVRFAKHGGEKYALALANRSATLVRMKRYEDCLSDIKLALANDYPNEQRHKLYLRQADCYIESHQLPKAKESIDSAITHAQSLELSPNGSSEFERHIKILEKKMDVFANNNPKAEKEYGVPDLHLGVNPNFVSASSALEIRHSDKAGRFVITKSELHRGDVLFVEEPYAFVTLPIYSVVTPIACEACCMSNINPVPCSVCSQSVYCSEKCRIDGWETFHQWECAGAQCKLWPTIGIAHLAIRVLLISTNKGFPDISSGSVRKPVTVAEVYSNYASFEPATLYSNTTPDFYRMFNLVTNFDKMNKTDYIQYALTALTLTLYLEKFTKYFDYLRSKLPFVMLEHELKLFAASLLLRHMGQLVCNGHAIMSLQEFETNGLRSVEEREVRLATAIYPSASLMNHSCDPNIVNSFHNCRLVVSCSRELPPNGEILNCYGPSRAREPAADRRAQLRAQYLFNCCCSACADPDRKDFVLVFNAYACQNCKGAVLKKGGRFSCQQCKNNEFNLERALGMREKAEDLLKHADNSTSLEDKCEKLQSALKLKQQVLHRHHTALRDVTDRLACLYAEMGEYSKSIDLIKQNIPSLEYQFGSFSVEVAHELRKLSAVMLERIVSSHHRSEFREWCLETHKIIKKALQLLELNYGGWEPLAKRLRLQESFVAGILAERRATASPDNSIHSTLHYNLKI